MTRATLVDVMDAIDWSPKAVRSINSMLEFTLQDEGGAAVIMAAALIVAREFPAEQRGAGKAIEQIGTEFSELISEASKLIALKKKRPALCVVGGTDTQNKGTSHDRATI